MTALNNGPSVTLPPSGRVTPARRIGEGAAKFKRYDWPSWRVAGRLCDPRHIILGVQGDAHVTARSFTLALMLGTILLNAMVVAMVALTLYQSRLAADARAQVSTATLTQVVEQNIAAAIH